MGNTIVSPRPGGASWWVAPRSSPFVGVRGRRVWRSAEDERELVLAAKRGDPHDRELFVVAFRPSVAGVARMYRGSLRVEWNELMQEGVVGLLQALERYDDELGVPFWTYASWWVRQAMQHVVSELSRPIVLSDRALRQLARIKDARRALEQARGREATCQDVAALAELPRCQVESLMCTDRPPRGLDDPVRGDTDEHMTAGELLADPPAEDAYERVERGLLVGELPNLLGTLNERERTVICSRYGIGRAPRTLREIGITLRITAERVRQIEQASLEKLSAAIA